MKLRKCLKQAFGMVIHSRLRSWLTILGIVIGVAAVVAILSISTGMRRSIDSSLGALGGDIITVTPGFSRGMGPGGMGGGGEGGPSFGGESAATSTPTLDKSDLQVLKSIPNIALIDTQIRGSVNVSYLGKSGKVSLTGVDQKVWAQITTSTIADGRMLDSADQNVVVIGGRLASDYFSQPLGVNKMISIGGNAFRIVGILDDESTSIYMPIQMAYSLIDGSTSGVYDSFVIKIKDESLLNESVSRITSVLLNERHVTAKTKDFSVTSSKLMQETRNTTMQSVNLFLVAIAAVSLIVGAIGVANSMFTSVLEKTREIGIMKAIGARNHDILIIFLFNSVLIGLVGGILGVILGGILSTLLPVIMGGTTFVRGSTSVTASSVILAISVSVVVGIVAGIIPAYQASKLKPVDALRFE